MTQTAREFDIQRYRVAQEPYYVSVRGEVELFTTAAKSRMPVMLKGPTGCGKTRFVQHMAYRRGRPLITVSCHEDLTASDHRPLSAQGRRRCVDCPFDPRREAGLSSISMKREARKIRLSSSIR